MDTGGVHTVCQEAQCPNIWECFDKHTATFLILGNLCTRSCRFCAIEHGEPSEKPVSDEPQRVASLVTRMKLKYVTITSVTRDDLPDGGASHFAQTIRAVRQASPNTLIEVLIPDFQGEQNALQVVIDAQPNVLNHNMETVLRLYPLVRPQADYHRSLALIRQVADLAPKLPTKSGLMLGLGETEAEIEQTLKDIVSVNCRILTLGQYLQPTKQHLPVVEFVPPEDFDKWREVALGLGFGEVASGPFVRSSYQAEQLFQALEVVNNNPK